MKISRRHFLQGMTVAASLSGASLTSRRTAGVAGAAEAPEASSLVLVFTHGGYNAIFGSASTFLGAGQFGVGGGNVLDLGGGLVVDSVFGGLPEVARQHMATIGIRHNQTDHAAAQSAILMNAGRSAPLQLAAAIGGDAAIKAVNVGPTMLPYGSSEVESGVSMQAVRDLDSAIAALAGDPSGPNRGIVASALEASQSMSAKRLENNTVALGNVREAYKTAIAVQRQTRQFAYADVASAYGQSPTAKTVNSFAMQMVAAEVMITAGANVVTVHDFGSPDQFWDTHEDRSGGKVRALMGGLVPSLGTFCQRMMTAPGRNVVVAIVGDFARSLPGSDHAAGVSATVIGKNVVPGTTGRFGLNGNGDIVLPEAVPSSDHFWGYLAKTLRVPTNPFVASTFHDALVA